MAAPPPPLVLVALALTLSVAVPFNSHADKAEHARRQHNAMEKLLQVFGLQHHVPTRRERHTSPPQYMIDLYNTIADQRSGVTRHENPYNADVVRSYPDGDSTQHHLHFFFNISGLDPEEKLLEAEFHVYKLKPRVTPKPKTLAGDVRSHLLEMRVYQVRSPLFAYQENGNRLLDARRISAHSTGWEVFHVRDAVIDWLRDNDSNYGLLVTLRTLAGEKADASTLRVVKRRHHNGRQPILVLFTSDTRKKHYQLNNLDSDMTRNINWNEVNSADSVIPQEELHKGERSRRERRSLGSSSGEESDSNSTAAPTTTAPPDTECARHEWYVNFEQIGWSSWIISPKGYDAYYCSGQCSFPLGQNQRPTNHATVQSIVHEIGLQEGISSPCCVPNKLASINLLYFDESYNVILRRYDDMVADSCGCH